MAWAGAVGLSVGAIGCGATGGGRTSGASGVTLSTLAGGGGLGGPASSAAPGGAGAPSTAATAPVAAPYGTKPAANGGTPLLAGTDAQVAKPSAVTPEVQANLTVFGRAYLGYDYRTAPATRTEALRPVTTPQLFAQLTQPLPAALAQQLQAEHRVVTVDPVSVVPVDAGVFRATFSVHTLADGLPAAGTTSSRVLIVTVDAQQRVSDVR